MKLKFTSDDDELMTKQNDRKSEQVFSELSSCGYSKEVAKAIWRWYHPSKKVAANV